MTEPLDRVTLEDETGATHEFEVYGVIDMEDVRYALLIPAGEDEEQEEIGFVVLRVDTDEDGEEVWTAVEDDDELDRVEAFLEQMDDDEGVE